MAATNHCLTGPAISWAITLIDMSGSVLRHNYFRWLWRRQNNTDQCVLVLLFVDFDWSCLHWLSMWLLRRGLLGEWYRGAADMSRPGACNVIGSVDLKKTGTAFKQTLWWTEDVWCRGCHDMQKHFSHWHCATVSFCQSMLCWLKGDTEFLRAI